MKQQVVMNDVVDDGNVAHSDVKGPDDGGDRAVVGPTGIVVDGALTLSKGI